MQQRKGDDICGQTCRRSSTDSAPSGLRRERLTRSRLPQRQHVPQLQGSGAVDWRAVLLGKRTAESLSRRVAAAELSREHARSTCRRRRVRFRQNIIIDPEPFTSGA